MDKAQAFNENFFSFARMLGEAPKGATLFLRGPSFAAASGEAAAGENYALFGKGADHVDVAEAVRFFGERRADFVAPWLPETPCSLAQAFERHGIERRRIYTSMYLEPEKMGRKISDEVVRIAPDRAEEWGEAAWLAFGGSPEDENLRDYRSFGAYLANCGTNAAYALEIDGRFAAAALLHNTTETVGLYYFATRPEWRRRGCAARLLAGVTADIVNRGLPLVLLATEEGYPFYISCGFRVIGQVPIYSISKEV